ncbi:MAG: hypothetical protein QE271_12775 [Bacteriovoracaceae bacterium]|nr:hypothetical protein [Bacteriovoracaceae bacterium]
MENDFWQDGLEKSQFNIASIDQNKKFFEVFPNEKISLGHFSLDKENENKLFAHPHTIAALKKTKISWKELIEDKTFQCPQCQEWLHKNVWKYCPHCDARWNQ